MADYTPTQQAAIDRSGQYNSLPYNEATNPRGMANRGYKFNLTQAVNDVAAIAGGVKDQSTDAKAQADRAVAVVATRLIASSTSSVAIGTGSKAFTTVESLATAVPIRLGDFVRVSSTANPNNYMFGVVTAQATNSLTVNVTQVKGSGTLASWSIATTGPEGAATGIASVEADTSPKLGGNLDAQNRSIRNADLSPSIDEVTLYLGASTFA